MSDPLNFVGKIRSRTGNELLKVMRSLSSLTFQTEINESRKFGGSCRSLSL